ncbi:MAG TPA: L,D-transpeptidase [Pseudolabrys sp.]|nr:L,D-transpeptidase [Pseudolabrys sp.]
MRVTLLRIAAAGVVAVAFSGAARADVLVQVDKATQQMTVTVDGQQRYVWPVSTGVADYDTPDGAFTPFRMEKDHFSKEWDDAPMPYSIFFTKQGHAIHGTNHSSIGRPASHGCVRLHVKDAAKLWALVKKEGMSHTHIVLTGEIPEAAPAVARHAPQNITPDFASRSPSQTIGHANADADDDDSDDAVAVTVPRESARRTVPGYWRQYREEPRYYYYRVRPYLPPEERHGRGFLTFGY